MSPVVQTLNIRSGRVSPVSPTTSELRFKVSRRSTFESVPKIKTSELLSK